MPTRRHHRRRDRAGPAPPNGRSAATVAEAESRLRRERRTRSPFPDEGPTSCTLPSMPIVQRKKRQSPFARAGPRRQLGPGSYQFLKPDLDEAEAGRGTPHPQGQFGGSGKVNGKRAEELAIRVAERNRRTGREPFAGMGRIGVLRIRGHHREVGKPLPVQPRCSTGRSTMWTMLRAIGDHAGVIAVQEDDFGGVGSGRAGRPAAPYGGEIPHARRGQRLEPHFRPSPSPDPPIQQRLRT